MTRILGFITTLESYIQRSIEQLYSQNLWSNRTYDVVSKFLLRGEKPYLQGIAHTLRISPRHLHNKLNEEGSSYQIILDTVRKQIALGNLNHEKMSICEVALLLGFSEQSSFELPLIGTPKA
jgi:AraC-like DNA-binding protein